MTDQHAIIGEVGTFETSGLRIPKSVRVTHHAVIRMRERFPEFAKTDSDAISKVARREVTAALNIGRISRRQPAWTLYHLPDAPSSRGKRKKARGRNGNLRYVWNEAETRAYVIDRGRAEVNIITAVERFQPVEAVS